jgi:hypothetical protein
MIETVPAVGSLWAIIIRPGNVDAFASKKQTIGYLSTMLLTTPAPPQTLRKSLTDHFAG